MKIWAGTIFAGVRSTLLFQKWHPAWTGRYPPPERTPAEAALQNPDIRHDIVKSAGPSPRWHGYCYGTPPAYREPIIMLCYLNIAHLADKVKSNIYLDILLVLWYGSIMENQAETKFWTRVKKGPGPESCWLWTACTVAGYGRIRVNDVAVYAHRFSWDIHNGPIPAGLWVCHKCDVRSCVNPAHLFLSTATGNAADRHAKGRDGKVNDTHCARGHEFTPENTGKQPGGRYCRACASAARSRLYKIHRAEGKDR
jgi:hypothetical protein